MRLLTLAIRTCSVVLSPRDERVLCVLPVVHVASGDLFVVEISRHRRAGFLSLSDLIELFRALFFENAKIARLEPTDGLIAGERAIPSRRCPGQAIDPPWSTDAHSYRPCIPAA